MSTLLLVYIDLKQSAHTFNSDWASMYTGILEIFPATELEIHWKLEDLDGILEFFPATELAFHWKLEDLDGIVRDLLHPPVGCSISNVKESSFPMGV